MPITKSAKKALRQTLSRTDRNKNRKLVLRRAIRVVEKAALAKDTAALAPALSTAYKLADKAVKQQVIHKNKAAHIKSRLAKLAK